MAGTPSADSGGRSLEGVLTTRCNSGEALAEWRSSDQVENGTPSTSPPYWDSDDEDGGPKPTGLYGKHTWKIDKFSQINKRELRSNAFEVGGYKWYILIYPQGCDVCNHLSLFLCVANHDKLLPGWSHFAQFTIAVVNKDPKKSKYSDTLHRFWKKEHDWGWKKFMELSKVLDGFIESDTLIIKAQVQVIRERADRPFRCLDCQYRRELVRVYLTNVEQICRRFVEERRGKLAKLIEDKARWSSFCAFWMGMEQGSRRRMSRERTDSILKVIVKHFFIEKEVTSTLVMDSLYSGLKALEGQPKGKKSKAKIVDSEELPAPIVRMETDTFVLVDDVLLLLERAALEPLPPKDEKGPQNRTKDGCSGDDFNKDSIERDERRLTELGRRTIEIFVLAHIFSSKIEVAYQEAVALKRQEELIREEEAAWLAESEQKAKRGADKEKKSKKKQAKQKKNNRKAKDKVQDEKSTASVQDDAEEENIADSGKDFMAEEAKIVVENLDTVEDVSDVSDSVDCAPETLQPDSEDRDTSPVNWDTDTSEVHPPTEASGSEVSGRSSVQNGTGERRSTSMMDDSSSTCSSDSVPPIAVNGSYKGNHSFNKNKKSPNRRNERSKATYDPSEWSHETFSHPSSSISDIGPLNDASRSCKVAENSDVPVYSPDKTKWPKLQELKKDEVASPPRKRGPKEVAEVERISTESKTAAQPSPRSPLKNTSPVTHVSSDSQINPSGSPAKKLSPESPKQADASTRVLLSAEIAVSSKPSASRSTTPNPSENFSSQQGPSGTENPSAPQLRIMSRPLSAPIIPGPRPAPPVVSLVQTTPMLSRSVSAAGRLGPEPSTAPHNYVPQSYRNVMMGSHVPGNAVTFTQPPQSPSSGVSSSPSFTQSMGGNAVTFTQPPSSGVSSSSAFAQPMGGNAATFTQPPHSPSSGVSSSPSFTQSTAMLAKPFYLPQSSERMEPNVNKPIFSFGMVNHEAMPNGQQWNEGPQSNVRPSMSSDHLTLNEMRNFEAYNPVSSRSQDHHLLPEFPPCTTSGRQAQGAMADEFPHLDIINDLLDDEQVIGRTGATSSRYHGYSNGHHHHHHLNRQFSYPGDIGLSASGDIGLSSDMGTSTSSRFERTRSYQDEGFRYGAPYDANLRDMVPPSNMRPYGNGHMDGGLMSNQWPMSGSDRSFITRRNMEGGEVYPSYHNIPDYSSIGVNTYTVFRPSNGH